MASKHTRRTTALAILQKAPVQYRLAGTGARPDSLGYYQLCRWSAKRGWEIVSEGETPYQAISKAGLYSVWGEIPRPSWAVLSETRTIAR